MSTLRSPRDQGKSLDWIDEYFDGELVQWLDDNGEHHKGVVKHKTSNNVVGGFIEARDGSGKGHSIGYDTPMCHGGGPWKRKAPRRAR